MFTKFDFKEIAMSEKKQKNQNSSFRLLSKLLDLLLPWIVRIRSNLTPTLVRHWFRTILLED